MFYKKCLTNCVPHAWGTHVSYPQAHKKSASKAAKESMSEEAKAKMLARAQAHKEKRVQKALLKKKEVS